MHEIDVFGGGGSFSLLVVSFGFAQALALTALWLEVVAAESVESTEPEPPPPTPATPPGAPMPPGTWRIVAVLTKNQGHDNCDQFRGYIMGNSVGATPENPPHPQPPDTIVVTHGLMYCTLSPTPQALKI